MKRILSLVSVVLVGLFFVINSCTSTPDSSSPSKNSSANWQTIIFDDFNRANTANLNVGTNLWVLSQTSGDGILKISNNHLFSSIGIINTYSPAASYSNLFLYNKIRVSCKFISESSGIYLDLIFCNKFADTGMGSILCAAGIYGNSSTASPAIMTSTNGWNWFTGFNITDSYQIKSNTTYLITFTIDNPILTLSLKDANNMSEYAHLVFTNTNFSTINLTNFTIIGRSGLYPTNIYIDDLRIETN